MSSQKGFTLVEGLIIVLVISVIGFSGYYVWDKQSPKINSNENNTEKITEQLKNEPNEDMSLDSFTTSYTFVYPGLDETYSIGVNHPENWKAETYSSEDSSVSLRNYLKLKSPDGTLIYLNDADGIGSSCSGDTLGEVTYKIKDRVNTNTTNQYFVLVEASKYSEGDSVDSYIPVGERIYYPASILYGLEVGESKTRTYSSNDVDLCTPLENIFRFGENDRLNIVVTDQNDDELLSPFSGGVESRFMQNPEIRSILESLYVSIKN